MGQRRWIKWAIGAVVVVMLLVVGGPFVYIHFIEGKAPAPLSLATEPTSTTQAGAAVTTVVVDGKWNVTGGSQAGYRIQEVLFGQSNTAVGRTSAVTGSITITGATVGAGNFSVDMTQVTSDESERDGQFQNRIMDTATYPTASFVLTKAIQLGTLPADGVQTTATATGTLTMHGATKSITFQVSARRSGATITVSGSIPIVFADWNISNPSGGPAAVTANHGILEFLLNFMHS